MRIPSATGLVFASLALSGSSLAAPTPASPNPSSPNPSKINSPRPDVDSPRFPNSPSVGSARSFGQASFLNRRNNRVQRPLGRKRSLGPDPSASGLAPDGSDGVAAAPMQRSLAHMSARGDGTVQAEGLGLIDKDAANTVQNALHQAADVLKTVKDVGPALAELLDGVGDTIIGVLGPDASPPRERRALPHRMRRQASAEASTADGTVNTEGLGLIPVATGKQLDDALHAIGGAVGEKVPIVGPIVGGLLGTVGDLLTGLITRDHIPDAPIDAESLPASAYQQLPAGLAYSASSPYVGFTPGQAIGEFVGPDGRVYQEIAEPFSQAMQAPGHLAQHAQQAAGNVIGQASGMAYNLPGAGAAVSGVTQTAGQTLGAVGGLLPTGLLGGVLGSVQGVAGGPLGTAQGLVGGVVDTASGVANVGQIIGYLSNGLPVFSTAAASVQALSQAASGHAHPQDVVGQVGQTVSGVHQTVSGMVAGSPAGAAVNGASSALFNSPAGSVVGAAQAEAGNIPVAGGMLGSLPIIGKDGNAAGSTFGILSNPSDPSAASASPDESGQNLDQPTNSTPEDDPDSGEDDGEEDDDSEDGGAEGKDPTDDNDDSSQAGASTPSGSSSVAAPSAAPSASTTQSVAQGTPTPALPSSTA
ncbi:hypothetical protein M407DRAFT_7033 [Tulasnella calospora MUT 4182]|uniref:Uncharacterized protein n=1 Tax=Tulasnella calospora MUT 4182 TaxID=1051891 RepID=A0A0C3QM88_9AGAM|nr:hypothetical protein M407DRAFT_7033 [Tulasnella calospora MUT 4182]